MDYPATGAPSGGLVSVIKTSFLLMPFPLHTEMRKPVTYHDHETKCRGGGGE